MPCVLPTNKAFSVLFCLSSSLSRRTRKGKTWHELSSCSFLYSRQEGQGQGRFGHALCLRLSCLSSLLSSLCGETGGFCLLPSSFSHVSCMAASLSLPHYGVPPLYLFPIRTHPTPPFLFFCFALTTPTPTFPQTRDFLPFLHACQLLRLPFSSLPPYITFPLFLLLHMHTICCALLLFMHVADTPPACYSHFHHLWL